MKIENVAVCGMGALGMLYATHIIDNDGADKVHFVMDAARLEKYGERTFYKNGAPYRFSMRDCAQESPADLVIVAVKSTGLQSAMDAIAKCVGRDTIIMSVLNGITSEDVLAERFGSEHMIYTVAQGMDAVKAGEALTFSKMGKLIIGEKEENQAANLRAVSAYFDRIQMPYAVEDDIVRRLWGKWMLNVGINQACMVYEANYGECMNPDGEPYRTMVAAMREVIAIARCEGVDIGEGDLSEYVRLVNTLAPEAMPSMRQDGLARRPSEVEMFAGSVRTLGQKHGILTPANDFLYRRVKEIESAY